MAKTLDATDAMMISLLRADARLPLVTLARRVGLSRSATQERLRRLEQHGIILGYTIRVRQPGQGSIQAWLIVNFKAGYACADVVPPLLLRHEVRLCHSLTGPKDLLVRVETASMDELLGLREHLMAIPGVAEIQTFPILAVHSD